jgi:hypothetical protein
MNINIHISGDGVATRSQSENSAVEIKQTATASSDHQDGGAPAAQLTGADSSQSVKSDVTDIGAPPQWLYEAVSSGKDVASNVSSSNPSSSDGTDAGGPPSFD